MHSSFWFDTLHFGWSIVHIWGVRLSFFRKMWYSFVWRSFSSWLMKCSIMVHFIWVFTVCKITCVGVSRLQRVERVTCRRSDSQHAQLWRFSPNEDGIESTWMCEHTLNVCNSRNVQKTMHITYDDTFQILYIFCLCINTLQPLYALVKRIWFSTEQLLYRDEQDMPSR